MTLTELHNQLNPRTDKGATHDYINGYYNEAFADTSKPIKLLEIGVYMGGSLQLWSKHFGLESKIYGFDVEDNILPELIDEPNIFFEFKNGYSQYTVELFEDDYFDYIIDDGPHTLGSQLDCMLMWNTKLKAGGKFIIEDIQNESDLQHIVRFGKLYGDVKVFDLRPNKGRYDDIIVEITKK